MHELAVGEHRTGVCAGQHFLDVAFRCPREAAIKPQRKVREIWRVLILGSILTINHPKQQHAE
jgi:hypothetical protein